MMDLSRNICDVQQALLGSSGELQNGHRQSSGLSGEPLPGLSGLRFSMTGDRPSGSGQHLVPGSPNSGERSSDPAVLSSSGQHGRSESMGSEAHLQVSGSLQHAQLQGISPTMQPLGPGWGISLVHNSSIESP